MATQRAPRTTGIYLSNRNLLEEVVKCKAAGKMSNELVKMLQLLCAKYASRGNYVGYSYNEDMQAYAIMMLVRTWDKFNPDKSSNAFAFFTQCIKNSFTQYLNQEKKHRVIRDTIMVDMGLNPSYAYGEDTNHNPTSDDVSSTESTSTLPDPSASFASSDSEEESDS